ncbi:hypothetical protein Tco_1394302 [Tanacetum coccineum]
MVIAASTIPVSTEENLRDPIDIRVDIIHPEPVAAVAFPAAAIEELTALSFMADIAEAENASLRARIKTTEAIDKITRNCERQARVKIEQQLAAVQESQRQDREDFRKLKELVSAGKACQQALWMKQALIDYGIRLDDVPIMCDNKGAIDLSKNPVQHSRTKHIEIRHHFLRDNVQKGNISIEKVASEDNIADIFTKPLKREVFNYLRLGLGMMELIMDSDPSSSQK